ncbi:MAG: hypothetical protein R3E83_05320 [Burkholderiaceae bacterium]
MTADQLGVISLQSGVGLVEHGQLFFGNSLICLGSVQTRLIVAVNLAELLAVPPQSLILPKQAAKLPPAPIPGDEKAERCGQQNEQRGGDEGTKMHDGCTLADGRPGVDSRSDPKGMGGREPAVVGASCRIRANRPRQRVCCSTRTVLNSRLWITLG